MDTFSSERTGPLAKQQSPGGWGLPPRLEYRRQRLMMLLTWMTHAAVAMMLGVETAWVTDSRAEEEAGRVVEKGAPTRRKPKTATKRCKRPSATGSA